MSEYPIGHVAICVYDLEKSVQFYRQLGLELSYQTPDVAYFRSGNQGIALMREGSTEAKPHFGFTCTTWREIKQRHGEVARQGLFVTPIQIMEGGATAFSGQDPSGNWFEYFYEPTAPQQKRDRYRPFHVKGLEQ